MVKPTISVLMPVYNAEKYLAEAVESILNQTFTDFEFLIVDDGSRDRSLKILQRYAQQDSRIRLISRENRGFVATLNELIAIAQGSYLARMDADDISLPDRFQQQVDFLNTHPEVVCVGGEQDWIDDAGRTLMHCTQAQDNEAVQALALIGQTPINHPSAMMRRDPVIQLGGYDEAMFLAEDLDLWLKLGEIGQLANLPATVVKYRLHANSISETRQVEQTEQRRRACEAAWQRRGILDGQFQETKHWRPFDRPSLHAYMLRYGWRFFNTGQRWAAILYGYRAVKALPQRLEGWKLLTCALMKPLPQPEAK
jgi:glycosyltransferase involved in cell wall biosynthesis